MTSEAIDTSRQDMAEAYAPQSILNSVRSACTFMRRHAARKRAERDLREMNPRMLKDIGIDRSEIMSVVYTGKRDRRS